LQDKVKFLFEKAVPVSLTAEEKHFVRAFPSPESLVLSQPRALYSGPTLQKLLDSELDDEGGEDAMTYANWSGKKRELRCESCDDSFHWASLLSSLQAAPFSRLTFESIAQCQADLFAFHKTYHSKHKREIDVCPRCTGLCPLVGQTETLRNPFCIGVQSG
jgi:hypothetical protein